MDVNANLVRELRDKTGAGVMDCKTALAETKGDLDQAVVWLREKGIAVSQDFDGPLRPGSVVFVETPEGVRHRDYVTHAWTQNPLKEVLVKMAATPALTRVATSSPENQ